MKTRRNHLKLPALLTVAAVLLASAAAAAGDAPVKGWLGVEMQEVTAALDRALGLDEQGGVLLAGVVEDSPAQKAGLEIGDVITAVDGRRIESPEDLAEAIGKTEPGTEVEIEYVRDGKARKAKAEVGGREYEVQKKKKIIIRGDPGREKILQWFGDDEDIEIDLDDLEGLDEDVFMLHHRGGKIAYLGVEIADLTEQLGEYFGVENGEGALVQEVAPDTPAADAGLEAGDVIVKMGGEAITGADDVRGFVWESDPGDEVEIQYVRKGKTRTVGAVLGENEIAAPKVRKFHRGGMPRSEYFKQLPRMKAPRMERMYRLETDDPQLQELREELKELQEQMKKLQEQLKER